MMTSIWQLKLRHQMKRINKYIGNKQINKAHHVAKQYIKLLQSHTSKGCYYYNQLGSLYYCFNQPKKTLHYQKISINKPGSKMNKSVAYLNAGLCESDLNQPLKSIHYMKKAIKINPHNMEAYKCLAIKYNSLSDFKSAVKYQKQAFKLESNAINCALLGKYYNAMGKPIMSIKYTKKALNDYFINKKNKSLIYFDLGIMYSHLGLYTPAINYFKKSLKLNNQNDACYYALGVIRVDINQVKQSIRDIEHAIVLNPKNDYYYDQLGINLFNNHQVEWGINEVKQAIKLNPHTNYYYDIIKMFREENNNQEAQKYEEKLNEFEKDKDN